MMYGDQSRKLIASTNVREYFRGAVTSAMDNQSISAEECTVGYVVDLLAHFTRAETFFEDTPEGPAIRPLAMVYADAVKASTAEARYQALRRLGDVALFISGVFAESLNHKSVDVDYYVAMGGNAYGHLSESPKMSLRVQALRNVFGELAAKFQSFVDVLSEITEQTHLDSGKDILRLYELWVRTGSKRAARQLRELGIEPAECAVSRRSH
jgi:hypothetical protein